MICYDLKLEIKTSKINPFQMDFLGTSRQNPIWKFDLHTGAASQGLLSMGVKAWQDWWQPINNLEARVPKNLPILTRNLNQSHWSKCLFLTFWNNDGRMKRAGNRNLSLWPGTLMKTSFKITDYLVCSHSAVSVRRPGSLYKYSGPRAVKGSCENCGGGRKKTQK